MKKILELFTQTVALLATLFLFLFSLKIIKVDYPFIWELVSKSQLVTAIVTLTVGSFAFWIYWKQKNDYKSDIAKLILQEIRYAEQQLRKSKEKNFDFSLAIKLLPSISWHNNIHLFISDLRETEIDMITTFYSKVQFLDSLIQQIAIQKAGAVIPKKPSNMSASNDPALEFELLAPKMLTEVSGEIEFIYSTPIIDKLRKIANY